MASHERQALLSDDGGGRRGHDDAGKGGGTGVVVAPATDERSATATAGPGMSPLPPFRTTPWRWWWLFVFSLVACFQCLVWFTFSSVPTATKRYYGTDDAIVDDLLNMGPIVFMPVVPLVSWLLTTRHGLKRAVVLGAALVLLGTVVRALPSLLAGSEWRAAHTSLTQVALFTGQALNAAVGPLVMATPTMVSVVWFPDEERATATALAFLSNGAGGCLGFLLGPWLVPTWQDLPQLLYAEIGLAALPCLMILLYFPAQPQYPPSAAALPHRSSRGSGLGSGGGEGDAQAFKTVVGDDDDVTAGRGDYGSSANSTKRSTTATEGRSSSLSSRSTAHPTFVQGVLTLLRSPAMIALVVAGGVQSGVSSAWGGVLQQMLQSKGMTPKAAGVVGFLNALAGLLGAYGNGKLCDLPAFRHRLKQVLLVLFVLATAAFAWFGLMLPNPFGWTAPSSTVTLGAALVLAGAMQGALDPVIYEASAEMAFPVPEGTSAGLLTFVNNGACLLVLAVAPNFAASVVNLVMAGSLLVCFGIILLIRVRYRRYEATHGKLAR